MDNFLWWRDGVIYQVYPRSFADSNGDGLGDLRGILSRIDYLSSLGVDALWLSPIYPSPDVDFGYDVADHTAVDPRFGTLEDFDALVAASHRRGLRIVLDMVMNHTSALHAWFRESRAGKDSPRRDWYLWRDRPNNWKASFGGSAWERDRASGGEEIGMRDISLPRREILDPPGRRYWPLYKGRDGCRSPMQWEAARNAGFSAGRPWLPGQTRITSPATLHRRQPTPTPFSTSHAR